MRLKSKSNLKANLRVSDINRLNKIKGQWMKFKEKRRPHSGFPRFSDFPWYLTVQQREDLLDSIFNILAEKDTGKLVDFPFEND